MCDYAMLLAAAASTCFSIFLNFPFSLSLHPSDSMDGNVCMSIVAIEYIPLKIVVQFLYSVLSGRNGTFCYGAGSVRAFASKSVVGG